jgi:PBSX family phage portal protein
MAVVAKKERIRQSIRVTAVGSSLKRADTSRQIYQENEFSTISGELSLVPINPPYNPNTLAMIVERSNMLKQCIAAYVTNIGMNGFDVAPVTDGVEMDPDEKATLQSFIDCANADESLMSVHSSIVDDYEIYGYGYLEVIRDKAKRISILRNAPAHTIRVCPKSKTKIPIKYDIARGPRSVYITEYKTFRSFVQIVDGISVYFKEYGDPRKMDSRTGKYVDIIPEEFEATEIVHFRQKSTDSYGVPRWITQLPSILGSREAEEVNLRYFEDNTVPPMILSVSGGRLTSQSYNELRNAIHQQSVGKDRQHKILLVEAVPERDGLDEKGSAIQLKVDKLTDTRQSDGLFSTYDSSNQSKIRSAFRLPPAVVGLSQDVTFATANTSVFIAETQVYGPQRTVFDEIYNKRLVHNAKGLGLKTVKLVSRVPPITVPETLIKSLTALNVMGAVTPRTAIDAANRVMQTNLPQYPKTGEEGYEDWMDKPIIFVTRGTASQSGQSQKPQDVKDIEDSGDISQDQPEHGQE